MVTKVFVHYCYPLDKMSFDQLMENEQQQKASGNQKLGYDMGSTEQSVQSEYIGTNKTFLQEHDIEPFDDVLNATYLQMLSVYDKDMQRETILDMSLQNLSFRKLCQYIYEHQLWFNVVYCTNSEMYDNCSSSDTTTISKFLKFLGVPPFLMEKIIHEIENVEMHYFDSYIEPLIQYK